MWLVIHFTDVIAEIHCPKPNYARIFCLFSVNIQQASIYIIFFPHGEIQLHGSAFILADWLFETRQNIMYYWQKVSTVTAILFEVMGE